MKNKLINKSSVTQAQKMLFRVVPDLTVRWSISRGKIYELIKSGKLQSVTIGTSRRVTLAAVEAFESSLVANGSV
jgi:excisionase family DNA binding protein